MKAGKGFFLWVVMGCCFIISACSSNQEDAAEIKMSPYIEAYTSGTVSRFTPLRIILTQDMPAEEQSPEKLAKSIRLTPAVKGTFRVEDNRQIIFTPNKSFERDTRYRVKVDLATWFGDSSVKEPFEFSFRTVPAAMRAELNGMSVEEKSFTYDFTIFTSDRESSEEVEGSILLSIFAATAQWNHSADGKRHQLIVKNVPYLDQGTSLTVLKEANKMGIKSRQTLFVTPIPAKDDFSIYDVRYEMQPEKFIEISFTKALDKKQPLEGIVGISGIASQVSFEGNNKIRIYPNHSDKQSETAWTVFVSRSFRANDGSSLSSDFEKKINSSENLPNVRFLGEGTIIPQSEQLTVPFQAIGLRGVVVRVIKIFEQNIGSFFQSNQLGNGYDLLRFGRLVSRQTIFLDELGSYDLTRWNTFALDLNKLIKPEPGAIYRIELSFSKELACPQYSGVEEFSKDEIRANDRLKLAEELSRFDEGGYYYYSGESGWEEFNYQERMDPSKESYYVNKVVGKNVLASDLGIMATFGTTGKMDVLVHNLISTFPESGVKVTLYNYQNLPIKSATTDGEGRATFALEGETPYYLIASSGKQRGYLRVDASSSLSMSSFDVSGEALQKGLKGFIYGDRGVWRPGDTLHLTFMLNDKQATIPAKHPVVMELFNPLGQSYLKRTSTQGVLGIYAFDMPIEQDAPTGFWNVKVSVGGAEFNQRLRIETIKPNRLKIDLTFVDKLLQRSMPLNAKLHTEWLQGAVAKNLKYDIQATFIATKTEFKGYESYTFDNPAKLFSSEESSLIQGVTDDAGNAVVNTAINVGQSAPGMLLGSFTTKVYESTGDFSIDAVRALYSPYRCYVGIEPPVKGTEQLETDHSYTYKVVALTPEGKPIQGRTLEVKIYKVDWYWWWSADNSNLANFVSNSYNRPVRTTTITTDSSGAGEVVMNIPREEWGTYFVSVADAVSGGHSTGVRSYFDWPGLEGRRDMEGTDKATLLRFKLDKDSYAPGDRMIVTIPSSKGARAIVCVENGNELLSVTEQVCEANETRVEVVVTDRMLPNAYVYVTLIQPYAFTKNDLPIRMYGVVPFTVNSPASHLEPQLSLPQEVKPEQPYQITVSEKSGREMAYTLAIVDEGLLDLTRFKTPDPWEAFNAREALGVRTWDMYNAVLGAYGGKIEQLFAIGGDDALIRGPKAIVNRFKPVVQFAGPFVLKKGGKAVHTFQMPNYNGRVRVMVVAGNGSAYGSAEKTMLVKNPIMVLGTLPRVLGVGDELDLPVTVFATQENIGDVSVSVSLSDNVQVVGEAEKPLHFTAVGDKSVRFRIRVKENPGVARIKITARAGQEKSTYDTELEIREILREQVTIEPFTLEAGKELKKGLKPIGRPGTNRVMLEVGSVPPVNLSSRIAYLTTYPHGCLEQIVSGAFPQLYLSQFCDLSSGELSQIQDKVESVLKRLRSYQTGDGAFAYWPGQSSTSGWGSVYAGHFMLEAEKQGYAVSSSMKKSWLTNQLQMAQQWKPVRGLNNQGEALTQAYRLYVLSLAQSPEIGAMNRLMADDAYAPITYWVLAAAYANIGKPDVAEQLTSRTTDVESAGLDDMTFGSDYRNRAMQLLTLCLLNRSSDAAALATELSEALSSSEWMSTQTTAFSLIALSKYMQKYPVADDLKFVYRYGGQDEEVDTPKQMWMKTLADKSSAGSDLEIRNEGTSPLFGRVVLTGMVKQGETKASSNGIKMDVRYVDKKGVPVSVNNVAQGTDFMSVVRISNPSTQTIRNLVVTQIVPAGWEILNTRFLNDRVSPNVAGVNYQDFRDDRVCSYIDELPSGSSVEIKIDLYAAYAGTFLLPAVSCEAMYDSLIKATTTDEKVVVK